MTKIEERRKDIDGLRAIAVLSVLVFHMNARWLPGGFAGVDIFFVISSYLITRLVLTGLEADQFSFKEFYYRRIKRIFPMSAMVFLLTVLVASQTNSFLLVDAKFIPLLTYNMHVLGYFTADSQKNFFLHYWSLVIEEQFYLVWPLALFICASIARRVSWISLRALVAALALVVAVAGVIYGEFQLRDPLTASGAYFLSLPRFGELAIGAIVALLAHRPVLNVIGCRIASVIGLAGIALSFIILQEGSHPGFQSLVPTLSTAVLLASLRKDDPGSLPSRFLSIGALAAVGRTSYSLYLWHWPVLSIARFSFGTNELDVSTLFLCVVLIAALTAASYRFVERPIIEAQPPGSVAYAGFISGTATVLAIVVAFSGIEAWGLRPLIGAEFANVTVDGQNAHLTEGWLAPCWDRSLKSYAKDDVDKECGIVRPTGPRVLLVGDSHAAAIGRFVDIVSRREKFSVTSYEVGACQLSEWTLAARVPAFVRTPERAENCTNMLNYVKAHYKEYDAVFVVNAFNLFSGDYDVFAGAPAAPPNFNPLMLAEIAQSTRLVFFFDAPVIDRSLQYSPVLNWLGISIGAVPVKGGDSGNEVIKTFAAQLPNSRWVDLSEEYKGFVASRFLKDQRPLYVDTSHLNGFGGEVLADAFIARGGCLLCLISDERPAHERVVSRAD